jgi:hypothetical protein
MRAIGAATETDFAREFFGNELAIKDGRRTEVLRGTASRWFFAG